ncbi:MAG: hypothetical protein IH627_18185 [Rubrivivax sp.]|nr:hypothetical protein [Rubrivivax sp.]
MNKPPKLPARRAAAPAARPLSAKKLGRVDGVALLGDLRALVQVARERIATAANATYTQLCWQVGRRLLAENLQSGRAVYGKQILATVSQELTAEFSRPGPTVDLVIMQARNRSVSREAPSGLMRKPRRAAQRLRVATLRRRCCSP